MALTVQQAASWTPGFKVVTVACDNSYPTGGYPAHRLRSWFPE